MERALLVTVDFGSTREGWSAQERSDELKQLTISAGAKIIKEKIVRRHDIEPASYIGSGKAKELAEICISERINMAVFNNDLTGTQQKNLEDLMRTKVIDRTQLILDIFAKRAHSNEGKLQVELAQLMYLMPRLTGKGIYLSRLGGGIGTRGPGEQKLEVDRRRIRARVFHLKEALEDLSRRRAMMRKNRERFSLLTIGIIGYTNVGKSTLLNSLTDSRVFVEDKLFATLDPTVRKFTMPNKQKVLFVDTVGFLDHLPHHLIEAFKATLEEVVEADLLLHIVDMAHPKLTEQSNAVYKVLEELRVKDKPVITVLNKADIVCERNEQERIIQNFNSPVVISALKKEGFEGLINRILGYVNNFTEAIKLKLPSSESKILNMIYENGFVVKKEYRDDHVYVEAEVPARIKKMLSENPLTKDAFMLK